MAKRDGIIRTEEDEQREIYSKHLHMPKGGYVNFLMYLAGFSYFPRWVVRFLSNDFLLKAFERKSLSGFFSAFNNIGEALIVLFKGLRSLLTGDFPRLYRYFVKATSKTS
jgi:hypothetical protein